MSDPLTPPDCDLRDFPWMPLEVRRFRDSSLVQRETAEAVVAAVSLWCAAWHEVPAASLPDDDRSLARLAGYGRADRAWLKVRAGALHGFVKCSDGRFYHPLVAEKARDAWARLLRHRHAQFQGAIRQHNKRDRDEAGGDSQIDTLSFEEWEAAGRPSKIREWCEASRVTDAVVTIRSRVTQALKVEG